MQEDQKFTQQHELQNLDDNVNKDNNQQNKSQIQKEDQKQSPQEKISKKQLKKQLKRKKWEEIKLIKRKQKKEKEKEKKKMKKQLQKNQTLQKQHALIQLHQNPIFMKKRKQDYQQKMKEGLKVIIDLQFFQLMSQKQLNSLIKQLGYCHAVNRKAQKPFNFILTSVTQKRKQFIDSKYNGCKWGITMLPKQVHQQFNLNKLVYLTGDAEQTIDEFDEQMIYIIGGIVDHNRLKKITFNYANQHKIMTRKLPLDGIKLKTNVHLAVNHVWQWMLKYYNGISWKQALQSVLPTRKIFNQNQQ